MYEITTRGGGGENLFSLSVFRPLLIHFENVAQLLQQLLHILEYPATILYKTILKKKDISLVRILRYPSHRKYVIKSLFSL